MVQTNESLDIISIGISKRDIEGLEGIGESPFIIALQQATNKVPICAKYGTFEKCYYLNIHEKLDWGERWEWRNRLYVPKDKTNGIR